MMKAILVTKEGGGDGDHYWSEELHLVEANGQRLWLKHSLNHYGGRGDGESSTQDSWEVVEKTEMVDLPPKAVAVISEFLAKSKV